MRKVIIESPYAGDVETNIEYARLCVRDSILRMEAPIASHLLYTQPSILDDLKPSERNLGIIAGHAWMVSADAVIVYQDRGISNGMQEGINNAIKLNIPIEYRSLFTRS